MYGDWRGRVNGKPAKWSLPGIMVIKLACVVCECVLCTVDMVKVLWVVSCGLCTVDMVKVLWVVYCRHGAHNWEGPGALTALTAVYTLAQLTARHSWLHCKSSPDFVVFAGQLFGHKHAAHTDVYMLLLLLLPLLLLPIVRHIINKNDIPLHYYDSVIILYVNCILRMICATMIHNSLSSYVS